ncbi:MAG: hypothetical protein QF718_02405 [Phycisphaerales bacterium]|nr:hypothetical protein [Phycisphaerales bacterium]
MSRRIGISLSLMMVVLACGCRKTLFPKNEPITQFDAYNRMRYGPQITEKNDPFGNPEPALRERLTNRN